LGVGSATHCVHLWAADEAIPFPAAGSLPERAQAICESALHLVQALTASNHAGPAPRLAIVTRAAVAVAGESLPGLAASPLWGLGKSVALEHPELGCLCLDLPAEAGPDEARALRDEIRNRTEDQVALRDRHRHVARVIRDGGPAPQEGFECRPEAAYLITAGWATSDSTRPSGWRIAGQGTWSWRPRRGTRPEAEERIRRLGEAGVRLTVRAMDVADERQTDELFRELAGFADASAGHHSRGGYFFGRHFAGVDAGAFGRRAGAQGGGRMASAHLVEESPARLFSAVFLRRLALWLGRAGQLCQRKRLPGCAGGGAPGREFACGKHQLGGMDADWPRGAHRRR
jgi:hypothetical protein